MKLLIFGFVSFFVLLGVVAASTWQTTRANLVTICCMKAALEQDLCQAAPGSAKKILFVGNALTATYMIPWAVAYFAEQKKHPRPKVCQLLVPEWTLERHYTEGKFQKLIKAEKWDVVVLQEAVGRALEEKAEMNRYAKLMAKEAIAAGAKVLIYEPLGGKGHVNEQAKIARNSTELASELGVPLVPIGDCLSTFDREETVTGIDLYEGETRPSQYGAYLAACIFYEYIYGESCLGVPPTVTYGTWVGPAPTVSISSKDATILQKYSEKCLTQIKND